MKRLSAIAAVVLLTFAAAAWARAEASPSIIDARADLTRLKIAPRNAAGDGTTDDSAVIQSAMDFLAKHSGGTLIFPPGVYRVSGLTVPPGVRLVGTDRQQTVFRAWDGSIMFSMHGGELHNFTAYGTPTAAASGANWKVGTGGVGKGGTAKALMIIRVGNTPKVVARDVLISNVTALEARYDCLYTRGSQGLRVIDCEFDRAGRNVVSMVGNDEDFLISGCRFGSLWGLYHFDIEPNKGHYVQNGTLLNCVFDGSRAGEMNTDSWGKMLMFGGEADLKDRNVAVVGCRFNQIAIRVRGIFPQAQFLYNPQLAGESRVFVKVRTNKVGEFRDAVVRGNRFVDKEGRPLKNIISGATFTGGSVFQDNFPEKFNHIKLSPMQQDTQWKEDHPAAIPQEQKEQKEQKAHATPAAPVTAEDAQATLVTVPLMGHRFRFKDGKVLKNRDPGEADVIFHADPLMADQNSGIERLGMGNLRNYDTKPIPNEYTTAIWDARQGEVLAVKTHEGKTVLFKILQLQPKEMTIEYRFLDSDMAGINQ